MVRIEGLFRGLAGVACFALLPESGWAGPSTIDEIRAEYALVGKEKLKAFEIDFDAEGGGGSLTLHYNGGEIRSAVALFGEGHFATSYSIYYKDGVPFFIVFEESSWRFAGEDLTEDQVMQRRYYLANGKAIRVLEKEFKVGGLEKLDGKKAEAEAVNRPVEVSAKDLDNLLRTARLIVAARNGDQVEQILFDRVIE